MSELFRFNGVRSLDSATVHDFTLHAEEVRILQLASKHEKNVMIDCAIGEVVCREGNIEIAQTDRRRSERPVTSPSEERRRNREYMPLIWQPVMDNMQKDVAWVAGNGGLISNLKIWENVTLPMWYHTRRDLIEAEQQIMDWLVILGLAEDEFSEFMAAQPYSLESWQRKLAGLLRALMQMPRVLVVDAAVFDDVRARMVECWIQALDTYVADGRSILVIADKATTLPWEKVDEKTE